MGKPIRAQDVCSAKRIFKKNDLAIILVRQFDAERFRRVLSVVKFGEQSLVEFEETSSRFEYPHKATFTSNKFESDAKRFVNFAFDPESLSVGHYHNVLFGDFKILSVGDRTVVMKHRWQDKAQEQNIFDLCYRQVFSPVEPYD